MQLLVFCLYLCCMVGFSGFSLVMNDNVKSFVEHIGKHVKCGNNDGILLGLHFPKKLSSEGVVKCNGLMVFFPQIGTKKNKTYLQKFEEVKILKIENFDCANFIP
jgi:hypothetical protein